MLPVFDGAGGWRWAAWGGYDSERALRPLPASEARRQAGTGWGKGRCDGEWVWWRCDVAAPAHESGEVFQLGGARPQPSLRWANSK